MQTKITSLFLSAGFGKSIIFQMIPSVCSLLSAGRFDYPKSAILVIVCPLVSLISYLTLFNVRAMIREKLTRHDI